MSVWEPKVELDPLCSLGALAITCRPGGKRCSGCRMQDGSCRPGLWLGAETPQAGLCQGFGMGLADVWKGGKGDESLFSQDCSGKSLWH